MISLMLWVRHAAAATVMLVWAAGCGATTSPPVALPPPSEEPGTTRLSPPPSTELAPATAKISGRVFDAATGAPIEDGLVVMSTLPSGEQRSTMTDRDGQYEFAELPAAVYSLRASSSGYVGREFGRRQSLLEGTPIALREGEALERINFRLRRGGIIAGRILDSVGRPFPSVEVEALRPQFQDGQRLLVALGSARSNERGEFRIAGLPAGDYYVSAKDPAAAATGDAGHPPYPTAFYPGVASPATARPVRLDTAGRVSGVEFRVRSVVLAKVGGRMLSESGRPFVSAAVAMNPYADDHLALGASIGARVLPDATFEFTNVPPGRWVIRARGETERNGLSLFSTFQLAVASQDIANIVMTLTPGARLSGELAFDATTTAPPTDLTQIWVNAPMVDGTMFGGDPRTRVRPDGTFQLDSVLASERFIRADSLPDPWSLKAVLYRGGDITDTPLDLQKGEHVRNIRLVLTDQVTALIGTVRDERGEVVADHTVVALPVNPALWRPRGRHIRLAYPDLDGRYQIRGLPAGRYLVAAVEVVDVGELYEREILKRVAALAVQVTLREGETSVLDLRPAEAPPQLAEAGGRRQETLLSIETRRQPSSSYSSSSGGLSRVEGRRASR